MNGAAEATRKMRNQPLFRVVVVLFAALLAGFLFRPEGQRSNTVLRSFFRTTPDGVAALARGIERLGRQVEPRITPLVDADAVRGTVVLLRPRLPPSPREINALLEHVRTGGVFVYAPPYLTGRRWTERTPLMDSLGIWFRFRPVTEEVREEMLLEPRWRQHALTEDLPSPRAPTHGFRVFGFVDGDQANDSAKVASSIPLLTAMDDEDEEWIVAAELALDDGRIVVLSDAEPLSNEEAVDDPLAALAVRAALAYTAEADTVFFAEYHQGIRGHRTRAEVVRGFFLGSPGGRVLLHLVILSFLILACRGLRFGAPTPAVAPPDRERRSPLEHVSALGDLYRKAGAASTAALLLLTRLARATRHPPPRDTAEADTLLRRLDGGGDADTPLARARTGLHADPPDLTAVAAGIDEFLARRTKP